MARPSKREDILDTFEEILINRGASEATLDAIAEQTGLSKGGLIYHFASKADLLDGFTDRLLGRIDEAVLAAPSDPAGVIRWYLSYEPADPSEVLLWQSLLAAFHGADEGLKAGVLEACERYARPLDILEPNLSHHVRLIGDGLFFNTLIGMPYAQDQRVDRLIEQLCQQAAQQPDRSPELEKTEQPEENDTCRA